jgi:O-antigen ligase
VTSLTGDHRQIEGATMLLALFVLMGVAAAASVLVDRFRGELRLPRHAGIVALAVVGIGFGVAILLGTEERNAGGLTPEAGRLVTLRSNRYEYWRVAGRAFAAQPVRGVGAGGWAVRWRRERPFRESAHDAHSLYLQTAAELGLIGLILLGVWFGGVALAARAGPPGLAAVCAVWAVHVLLDWDFELPAATLPAMVAAGTLVGWQGVPSRTPRGQGEVRPPSPSNAAA